jgi:hypothetical protein
VRYLSVDIFFKMGAFFSHKKSMIPSSTDPFQLQKYGVCGHLFFKKIGALSECSHRF